MATVTDVIILTGYDHKSSDDIGERGNSVEVDARRSSRPVKRNFKTRSELDERISSMTCDCVQ